MANNTFKLTDFLPCLPWVGPPLPSFLGLGWEKIIPWWRPVEGKAYLDIVTEPVSGGVYIDGSLKGTAPLLVEVSPELHTVSFGTVEGYVTPSGETVIVAEGETKTIRGVYQEIPITPPAMKGDADGDGHVTWPDFVAFSDAYESKLGDPNYNPIMDFNDDGVIDIIDFAAFSDVYEGEPVSIL